MRAALSALIAVLALGGCSNPFEELYPIKRFSFKQDNRTYDVRAQWDPVARDWFTQTTLRYGRLERDDQGRVTRLVERTLGPQVCEGNRLKVTPADVWSGYDQTTVRYLPSNGAWHLVGACTG